MLIAFEGIDGAGKTTIIDQVSKALQSFGINNIVVREPGGTPAGEIMRQLIKGEVKKIPRATSFAQVYLLIASHLQLIEEVVNPAILKSQVVLTDRTTALSMRAYQVGGKGMDPEWIDKVLEGTTVPQVVVWLDVPVDIALRRNEESKSKLDEYDTAGREFMVRVRQQYIKMATSGKFGRWLRIDASQRPSTISKKIVDQLVDVLIDAGVIE
jgi:dTMP kinase